MVDVLIVGGGVAGSTLAVLLGRAGFSVELFEVARFPREKPCGEGMMPAGVSVLERLNLADAVGGAPFHGVRYHLSNGCTAESKFPQKNGVALFGRGQRRSHLDQVLFEGAARTAGVKAYSNVRVDGPVCENGRVTGVRANGHAFHARLVVAADGASSRLRHLLGLDARSFRKRFGIRVHYRLANGKEQPPWVDVLLAPGHELYVTPLPNSEVLVAVLTDIRHVPRSREAIYERFHRWIFAPPLLASLLEGADQISRPLCASWSGTGARAGVAPGIVLLGDAAASIDPISGGGMMQALVTAELLAGHIQNGLGASDEWIWKFECERQRWLADFKRLTRILLCIAEFPPLATTVLPALRNLPSVLSHFAAVAGGTRRFLPWHSMQSPLLPA